MSVDVDIENLCSRIKHLDVDQVDLEHVRSVLRVAQHELRTVEPLRTAPEELWIRWDDDETNAYRVTTEVLLDREELDDFITWFLRINNGSEI